MTSQPCYAPRPSDLPREQLMRMADEAIASMGGPDKCHVNFKFTCMWCGERCCFDTPNMVFDYGECEACGSVTPFTAGGFYLTVKFK